MTSITRRAAFTMVPVIGATAIAPASAEPAHPVQRLRELHEEASELMHSFNDHMGGRWALHIRASDDALPVFYENLCAGRTDPLLEAVEAFREGSRQFCALPDDFAPYADEDAAIEATYGPPFYVLDEWDQPA